MLFRGLYSLPFQTDHKPYWRQKTRQILCFYYLRILTILGFLSQGLEAEYICMAKDLEISTSKF